MSSTATPTSLANESSTRKEPLGKPRRANACAPCGNSSKYAVKHISRQKSPVKIQKRVVVALGMVLPATKAGFCRVDSMGFLLQFRNGFAVYLPNCVAYSSFNRCQQSNFAAS